MAGLLYYRPGASQKPDLKTLEAWSLGHAFDSAPAATKLQGSTPDGGSGLLMGDQKRLGDYAVGYYPAEQEWRQGPDWWVGWYTAAQPGPDDLARAQQLPGYTLTMGDGNQWTLPLTRNVDEAGNPQCALPAVLTMDASGNVGVGGPVAQYKHLWDATEWAWLAMVGDKELPMPRVIDTVGLLYSANYFIHARELFALGVFGTELTPGVMLSLAIGRERWLAWEEKQKKTRPQSPTDGLTISAGEAG